ncbi:hypothetical protein EV426DRAFT_607927 [Tirmania nivea]|nr:hypothetical protein EV426DRAFT_607927 [Tirmania nivea]
MYAGYLILIWVGLCFWVCIPSSMIGRQISNHKELYQQSPIFFYGNKLSAQSSKSIVLNLNYNVKYSTPASRFSYHSVLVLATFASFKLHRHIIVQSLRSQI